MSNNAAARKPGWYWVKFHREPDKWLVARWDDAQSWWITEATMELPHGIVCGDGRWSVIGPRIPTPDEVMELSKRDQLALLEHLLDPPDPLPRLVEAVKRSTCTDATGANPGTLGARGEG